MSTLLANEPPLVRDASGPALRSVSGSRRRGASPDVASPAELYGPLLVEVQLARIFEDGKTFVDAVPLRAPHEIREAFSELPPGEAPLRRFVAENFRLPAAARVHAAHGERDLRGYLRSVWPDLCHDGGAQAAGGSLLPVTGVHPVPGGRFAELYYWDSYFTILGLIRDGFERIAAETVEAFGELLTTYGRIPNGTRSYYLSRSQPPLYYAMLKLVPDARPGALRRRLDALLIEHAFWMDGAADPGAAEGVKRIVRMPDGAILNRYWDDRATPRDESYLEDVSAAARSGRDHADVFRGLRAGAESGWDFSSRWFAAGRGLESIRTPRIVPVDLNACLYGMERTIAELAEALCEDGIAAHFGGAARRRRTAVHRWLWHDDGHFCDFDLDAVERRAPLTAATLMPLFTGLASRTQAAQVARATAEGLLAEGGLRTTLVETGEQWDWPNGWAPLQWIAFAGLRRYGHRRLADTIATRWVGTVDAEFRRSGWIHEKYDVECRTGGGGGEYVPQIGFGWTNGVTATFIDLLGLGAARSPDAAVLAEAGR
ncbi:trehalase family glycosidase [Sphingomonas sp. RIT328]|uniref:trehalase family glycosidase n=1 Tax=Sphingomonas sp. RIT328 TaxID=1470591 RepID=UPI00044F9347|nr:trehalase family glycosidase [Sphingomonas sp. RIT328]EZP50030.1 Alpha,alpha-trehalase [Sphingomonas sp. RIT328]